MENGTAVDAGGPRKELLCFLLDFFRESFSEIQYIYLTGTDDNDELTSKTSAGERLFAYGVYSAIAIVQSFITYSFVLEWHDKLAGVRPTHPFIDGLQTLGVSSLILEKPKIKKLFKTKPININDMLKCVKRTENEDPFKEFAEEATFKIFCTFLQNVAGWFMD